MSIKKYCECGRLVAPGAYKYCVHCQSKVAIADRKAAFVKYHTALRALPQVRECKICGEVAFHAKTRPICTPCHLAKIAKKKQKELPEDKLFFRLMGDAVRGNRNLNKKIRPATEKRILEDTNYTSNLIGEL